MLQQDLERYFELKDQIKDLNAEYGALRNAIRESLPEGAAKTMVVIPAGTVVLQMRTRKNRKCKWDVFEAANPELYGKLVTESTTDYLSITQKAA